MTEKEASPVYTFLQRATSTPLSVQEMGKRTVELAALIMETVREKLTKKEQKRQGERNQMSRNPVDCCSFISLIDQGLRSSSLTRSVEQMISLLRVFGLPSFGSFRDKMEWRCLHAMGNKMPPLSLSLLRRLIRQTCKGWGVFEDEVLFSLLEKKERGKRILLHRQEEEPLSPQEVERYIERCQKDLSSSYVDAILVNVSMMLPARSVFDWNVHIKNAALQMTRLYDQRAIPSNAEPFLYFHVETHRELCFAKELFLFLLKDPSLLSYPLAITLPAYFPETTQMFEIVTGLAKERVKQGGVPIQIRLIKGNRKSLDEITSSLMRWPQFTYKREIEIDAHYCHLLQLASRSSYRDSFSLVVVDPNLFELALALLLRMENKLEKQVQFEFSSELEETIAESLTALIGELALCYPVVTKGAFVTAIPFLVSQLQKKAHSMSFLSHSFHLSKDSPMWKGETERFLRSFSHIRELSSSPRKKVHHRRVEGELAYKTPFENTPKTNFFLPENRLLAGRILADWEKREIDPIFPVLVGESTEESSFHFGFDPSNLHSPRYSYASASWTQIEQSLEKSALSAIHWEDMEGEKRGELLLQVARLLRKNRSRLIGALIADTGKSIFQADQEVSDAVDFFAYYPRSYRQLTASRDLGWKSKGRWLIMPPWHAPMSMVANGLSSALITGGTAIVYPHPYSVLAVWEICQLCWEAGIPKDVLQFIPAMDKDTKNRLICNGEIKGAIVHDTKEGISDLTSLRPDLPLVGETGGKNSFIITALADSVLAIHDLMESAFAYSGQSGEVVSLAIVEGSLYDDPAFQRKLRDSVASLPVGSAWNLDNVITPLIHSPSPEEKRALTTLEPGESWLLQPKQDSHLPNLWSPGIKWGVQRKSVMHQTQFSIPVLGVMRATNLEHAIHLANGTCYGLSAGLHSLDVGEHKKWSHAISVGNGYINRPITRAIVKREPFGGHKKSSVGQGLKRGGSHYLVQLMDPFQLEAPKDKFPLGRLVNNFTRFLDKFPLSTEELGVWYASISSYAFFWQQWKRRKDSFKLLGEDNELCYIPRRKMVLRITKEDRPIDYLRSFAAILTCDARLEVSWEETIEAAQQLNWEAMLPTLKVVEEDQTAFTLRVQEGKFTRVRMLHSPSSLFFGICASKDCYLDTTPVMANGRVELLHYLKEAHFTTQYHRYGYLGLREAELRQSPL